MKIIALTGWKTRLAILASISAALAAQPFRPMVFVGPSMSPTFKDHSWAVTLPADRKLDRGDVVVINREDGTIVKRIALVAGDRLPQMRAGDEWVDLIDLNILRHDPRNLGALIRYVTIPEGYVYVLGDNRTNSIDSRIFGLVPVDQVSRRLLNSHSFELPDPLGRRVKAPHA